MEKADVEKLFTLLGCFYPNARQLTDKNMQMAWCLAMEPYAYEDAKAAVADYARKHKYFPDVFDITGKLPEPSTEESYAAPQMQVQCAVPYLRRLAEQQAAVREKADALHLSGAPTWTEARDGGMSWEQWVQIFREAAGKLPPSWAALRRQGLTYAEAAPVMRRNWVDFWADHGMDDMGVP